MNSAFVRVLMLTVLTASMLLLTTCSDDDSNAVTNSVPEDTPDSAFFTFGGVGSDGFQDIVQTPDGGFAMVGVTTSFIYGSEQVFLVKTDGRGATQWIKNIGGPADEAGGGIVVTPDGGFAIAGWQDDGIYLAKTHGEGNVQWNKTFDGFRAEDIVNTPDGGFALACTDGGICVIKTDANGNFVWQTCYSEYTSRYGHSIVCTPDGGYAASGDVRSDAEHNIDIVVLRLSATGEILWSKRIAAYGNSWGNDIINTSDGGFLVSGMDELYRCGLFKLDDNGNVVWSSGFGSLLHTEGYGAVELSDGGFAVTGDIFVRDDDGNLNIDGFLARTDQNGDSLWMRTLGGEKEDRGMALVVTEGDSLAIVGYGSSSGAGDFDAYLYLTDENGQVLTISDE